MKKKFKLKTIIIVLLSISTFVLGGYILNNTYKTYSLPLGLLLLDLPYFFIIIFITVAYISKVKKQKKKTTKNKVLVIFCYTLILLYFFIRIFPLALDIFEKPELSELNEASIYYIKQTGRFTSSKQYYIKGYNAKKGYISFMIRTEDEALKAERNIKKNKLTKVYYYKNSNYVYKIITD